MEEKGGGGEAKEPSSYESCGVGGKRGVRGFMLGIRSHLL